MRSLLRNVLLLTTTAFIALPFAAPAVAQDKPTVKLLMVGYPDADSMDAVTGNTVPGIQHLQDAFNTNVIAAMMLSSIAVPLLAQRQGAIVFVGSVHNRRAYPGASPYAATKAAIEGLTRVMAAELGPRGIRVNCLVPGAVNTEINLRAGLFTAQQADARYAALAPDHALGRIGTAAEVAQAIEFLACADWVTGATLAIDGGLGLGVSKV